MRFQQPKQGAERTRRAFLLFPKQIGEETRWLEFASWKETYEAPTLQSVFSAFFHTPGTPRWLPTKWLLP